MRVRVSYVVEVNEAVRRGIRAHYGKSGLASREEVKEWYESMGAQRMPYLALFLGDEDN